MRVAVTVLLVTLVVLGLVAAAGISRLRTLSRRVGSFPCGARAAGVRSGHDGVGRDAVGHDGVGHDGGERPVPFAPGIAHYAVGRIEWYRCGSLAPRPARTWQRDRLVVTGRAPLGQAGQGDQYLVRCRYDGTDFELSMSAGAYAGLASWLEAAPPGRSDLVL